MRRPFVFHCEALAPVFFPFAHQGTGTFKFPKTLRDYYRKIFASPLCLGIFSHLPETLRDLSKFFGDAVIDGKLYPSRIGLSEHSFPKGPLPLKKPLAEPRFVFLNSAHQKSGGFFTRGGDIVLRFWKEFRALGHTGRLFMRCGRPEDHELRSHGVDVDFLRSEENRSVLWIDNYLTNQELNALLAEAHFLLLPSWSLHSASIMQAMAMGAVPVVSDTLGTSHYVTDDDNGIVLEGVFAANWHTDPETGILIDQYRRNSALDQSLVSQLTKRISALVAAPEAYERLRHSALARSRSTFSGRAFSEDFWSTVRTLHARSPATPTQNMSHAKLQADLAGCLIDDSQWQTIFESTCQPVTRLFTGYGRVTELGGVFIADDNSAVRHHDWSVLAKYVRPHLAHRSFAHSIRELEGAFLPECSDFLLNRLVIRLFELLRPVPPLHRFSLNMFRLAKRARNKLRRMKPDSYAGPAPTRQERV